MNTSETDDAGNMLRGNEKWRSSKTKISNLQHQKRANSMHTWQSHILVLLEDVDVPVMQQLGSNNHSTPQVRYLPQKFNELTYDVAQDHCHSKYGGCVDPCSAMCCTCPRISPHNCPCSLRLLGQNCTGAELVGTPPTYLTCCAQTSKGPETL